MNALVRSAVAVATLTPGFRRAYISSHEMLYFVNQLCRSLGFQVNSVPANVVMGIHATGGRSLHGPMNPGGMTPMIVQLTLPILSCCPRASFRPP